MGEIEQEYSEYSASFQIKKKKQTDVQVPERQKGGYTPSQSEN